MTCSLLEILWELSWGDIELAIKMLKMLIFFFSGHGELYFVIRRDGELPNRFCWVNSSKPMGWYDILWADVMG